MHNRVLGLLVPAAVALLAACGSSSGGQGSSASTAAPAGGTIDTSAGGSLGTQLPSTQAPVAPSTTVAAPSATTAAAASTPTDEPVQGDAQEIMINVDDPTQIGHTYPVPLGQTVVLRLLSDTDQTYHVHGYDLEQKAAAGVEASFEFTADQAGSFEVESHTTDKLLAVLRVS